MGDDFDPPDLGDDNGTLGLPDIDIPGFGKLKLNPFLPLPGFDMDGPSPYGTPPWLGPIFDDVKENWWDPPADSTSPTLIKPGNGAGGTDTPSTPMPTPSTPSSGPPILGPLPPPDGGYQLPMPKHPDAPTGHEPPTIQTDPSIHPPPFFPGGD